MANVRKEDRVQDSDVKRLNHVGLGIKAIAERLGCHPATITLRLGLMGVAPTDTRRSFMEEVWNSLDGDQQDWLSHNLLNAGLGVKEFVSALIKREYEANPGTVTAAPEPMPELEGGSATATPVPPSEPSAATQVDPEVLTGGEEPPPPPPAASKKPKVKFQ